MGIPLTEIKKFNVKGKVLIYKKDGELVEMNLKQAQEYARPECHHCGDFSAELADISCGGVGAMDWTITILRTQRGEELFDRAGARRRLRGAADGRVRDLDEGAAAADAQAARARAGAAGPRGGVRAPARLRATRTDVAAMSVAARRQRRRCRGSTASPSTTSSG